MVKCETIQLIRTHKSTKYQTDFFTERSCIPHTNNEILAYSGKWNKTTVH